MTYCWMGEKYHDEPWIRTTVALTRIGIRPGLLCSYAAAIWSEASLPNLHVRCTTCGWGGNNMALRSAPLDFGRLRHDLPILRHPLMPFVNCARKLGLSFANAYSPSGKACFCGRSNAFRIKRCALSM
jgi:hypothetical protein